MAQVPSLSDDPVPLRLRIGAAVVDFATREIRVDGARDAARVTPKSIAVLRLLAEQPGEVMTRSELLARAWPDTLPGDDVLTQAVTQLRKAFGAGSVSAAEGRRYIETISKTGYRLTVPVEVAEATDARAASSAPAYRVTDPAFAGPVTGAALEPGRAAATSVAWTQRWLVGTAALALVLATVLGLVLVRGAPSATSARVESAPALDRRYRLITTADGFELSPSLSPDASMVAYSASSSESPGGAGSVILVQTTTSAAPRVLSRPGPGERDDLPAWSPDGREIAFSRRSAGGVCRVLLVAATGVGDEREIARCDGSDLLSFDWLPDGSGLVFGTMAGAGDGARMRVLNPVNGRWRALDYPGTGDFDYGPRTSPDGRWIAFVRNPQMGDIWRVPAEGGEPQQLTRLGAEMRGLAWAPDSRGLVFGVRVEHESRLYHLDSESGALADLGIEDAQMPAISPRGGMLAFVHRRPHFGVRRIAADGTATPMFPSSGRDTQPMVSPDGRQLVFASDRAGPFELWWTDLARPESLRPIEGLRPDTRQAPDWSADGRRLLVSAVDDAGVPVIMELEPETGHLAVVPVPAARPMQAVHGPGDRLLVIEEDGAGRAALVVYRRDGWDALGRIEGVSQVRFDPPSGRVLYTRLDGDGLWAADATLTPGSIRQLSDRIPTRWRYRTWSVSADGTLSYLDGDADCRSRLARFRIEADALVPTGVDCAARDRRSATNGFSVGADAWWVSIASEDGSDIGFMALPPAETDPNRVAKWLLSLKKKVS